MTDFTFAFSPPLAPAAVIDLACAHAPYLKRLIERFEWSADDSAEATLDVCLTEGAAGDAAQNRDTADLMQGLRQDKARFHLALALLDIGGARRQGQVTRDLTLFADRACQAALSHAVVHAGGAPDGLTLFALGKMGASELNYSSDIDMIACYDADAFDGGARDPGEAASRIVREAMRILSERTRDGYVFRTDLRLRPDPSSTPLAVSTRRAELYYESVGQNWERMVWIKGRAAAGDLAHGEAFLRRLRPFVWRRHLDFWAIADVQAIKSMINAKAGDTELANPAADLKLGPGGIREIEFFVQTQQIILGGRNPSLRVRGTLEGLAALAGLGVVTQETADDLTGAYQALRQIEHRIQMLDDEQTHSLPAFATRRADVAALCGFTSLQDFDAAVLAVRRLVHRHYNALFADEARKRKAAHEGNLVFTGVDDDPGTVRTLTQLGFSDPSKLIERVRTWHRGRTPATRTTRGRELLTALLPDLLSAMSKTGNPDEAFRRFSRFFEGLRSGVQTLAMLVAEPELMDDLVTTLALAPRIGGELSRRPGLLEALLSVTDREAVPVVTPDMDFETAMDLVRRWHGERAFVTGHRLLHGRMAARDAATEWSELADRTVTLMARAALHETERRYGAAPGVWTIAGLGKFGGCEMTAGSDLDLLVIYDANDVTGAQTWFTRFTQRLITALSAETGEGALYEVDMRLRPSGRAGPVATSLAAFNRYHAESAWTWEHMALTRLRAVTGDAVLGAQVEADAARHIAHAGQAAQRRIDIRDMRDRLTREKPPQSDWDVKMRRGGLVDVEFIIQTGLLTIGTPVGLPLPIPAAIERLAEAGFFRDTEAVTIREAHAFLSALQQVQRVAVGAVMNGDTLNDALLDRMGRAVGSGKNTDLKQMLTDICEKVSVLYDEKVQGGATETPDPSV